MPIFGQITRLRPRRMGIEGLQVVYVDPVVQREYQRIWIAEKLANNPVYRATTKARIIRDRELRRLLVNTIKQRLGCLFCDERDAERLDFHHLNPDEKFKAVSTLVRERYRIEIIAAEIHKCVCVCKTHHADLTVIRADYMNRRKQIILPPTIAESKRRERAFGDALFSLESHLQFRIGKDITKLLKHVFGRGYK